jgi:ferritin-like metal-binding protein YciE
MTTKDLYLAWMNDAYALEKNIEEALERHADQAKDYPEIRQKINQHLATTREHAELVRECIERNGGNVSGFKKGMANIVGAVTGAASGLAKDTLIKNALAEYSSEHLEMASYHSLMNAANTIGDMQTARVCERILDDEQQMARWLEQQIPMITNLELERVREEEMSR